MIKNILLPALLCLSSLVHGGEAPPLMQEEAALKRALNGFFVYIERSGVKNKEIAAPVVFLKEKYEAGVLTVSLKEDSNIFPEFSISTGVAGVISVGVAQNILDALEKEPAEAYTSLIYLAACVKEYAGAVKGAGGVAADAYPKEIEREIKSCALQAVFIREYLLKKKVVLTGYEKKLLESSRDNNLYDFMFKYYRLDAEWLDYLTEVLGAESTAKGKLKQLNDIGLKKIEETEQKLKKEASGEDIYYALVMPVMYCKLVPYLVYGITEKNKEKTPFKDFKFEEAAPELAKTAVKLQGIIAPFLTGLDYSKKLSEELELVPKGREKKKK